MLIFLTTEIPYSYAFHHETDVTDSGEVCGLVNCINRFNMTGYLLIQKKKKKNILEAMLKCEKDNEFPLPKSRIIHITPHSNIKMSI